MAEPQGPIEGAVPGHPTNGEIVARLPKESLKALFYLFAGKPDSVVKVFNKPVLIAPDDLAELNGRVQEKLQQHHIEAVIPSVSVRYDKNVIKEFGTWAEFESHRWTGPEVTEELAIRWDFMVKLP